MKSESEAERAFAAIRSSGGRITASKRSVIEILASANQHLSTEAVAERLHRAQPGVAVSTVYRILEELVNLKIIEHSHAGKGPVTYHLGDHDHGHLVCQVCGTIIEAEPELFEKLRSLSLVRHNFSVDAQHFAVLGTCGDCTSASRV